ncbi:hypothetical protein [Endozoicomonas sp. 8E]|uniref:hypothetical protein n=1 Tax=Endozoicomonas sp. 8E TaxID=3035692 RepID=UPI002938EA90|nr:hypothetical protein [Endozoicomonas sp. 8E]WOG30142.1 hypothetical protein P6910_10950 [Endozoicomonas sp. 8E]
MRRQRWRISPPKTITIELFQRLVEESTILLTSLGTSNRTITAKAIADGKVRKVEGDECCSVYEPFSFEKIDEISFEVTFHKNEKESCQIHVEFRKEHVYLSVSDIETGWLDAIFEAMERNLKASGLFKGAWRYKLTSGLIRLQNIFLISGVALLIYPISENIDLSYVAISLIITGAIPAINDVYRLFRPKKPIQVIDDRISLPKTEIEKIGLWLGITSAIVALVKEAYSFVNFLLT